MPLNETKRGFSLIELLVASVITIAISGGIFSVMNSARSAASLARAKEDAKQMAEQALKYLQKDIAISHAIIDKNEIIEGKPKATLSFTDNGDSWEMKIPKVEDAEGMADDYVDVKYALRGNKLFREGGVEDKTKLVASNISKLEFFVLSQEQVSIEIQTEVVPSGQSQPVHHDQKVLVTIREAVTGNIDERWKTSEEVISNY